MKEVKNWLNIAVRGTVFIYLPLALLFYWSYQSVFSMGPRDPLDIYLSLSPGVSPVADRQVQASVHRARSPELRRSGPADRAGTV